MLVMLAAMLVMGCGLQQYTKPTDVAGYPYRHSDFDYKYAWKSSLRCWFLSQGKVFVLAGGWSSTLLTSRVISSCLSPTGIGDVLLFRSP